jgi:hypothetical protein
MVDSLVIVETTTDVLIAEDVVVVGTVIVEAYERYDPVGVDSVCGNDKEAAEREDT